MTTRTAYDPTNWPDFGTDPRRPALLDWLTSNGINPDDVPLHTVITVHDTDHGHEIRHVAYVRAGGKVRSTGQGEPVTEARAIPLTTQPPGSLSDHTAPTQ